MSIEKQIDAAMRRLSEVSTKVVVQAISTSLNKTATHVKARAIKGIAMEAGIKQKPVRQRLFIARSTPRKTRARVRTYTQGIPVVSLLSPSQRVPGKRRRGVKAGRHFFQGAFINTVKSTGAPQVMRRKGQERYPVEVLKIDIARPAQRIQKVVGQRAMQQFFPRTLAHELRYRLRKYQT